MFNPNTIKMRKIAVTLFAAILAINLSAQEFTTDDLLINAGAGFGWYSYGYGATSFPAISVSLEKGIKEFDFGTLGVGGIVGYKHASYSWLSGYDDWSWTDFIIAARGALHVDLFDVENLDTYGGAALGLRFESYKHYGIIDYEKVTTTTTHPLVAVFAGGRYYFAENFAGFAELGYGMGYFTVGLTYRIN